MCYMFDGCDMFCVCLHTCEYFVFQNRIQRKCMCNNKLNLISLKMHKKWDLHVLVCVEFEYDAKICVKAILKADASI